MEIKQTYACMASVTEPIWLTLRSRQLQARSSAAFSILFGLVTVRSSPTTWIPTWAVRRDQASQSSWSNGSSMDTTGKEAKWKFSKRYFISCCRSTKTKPTWVVVDEALIDVSQLLCRDVSLWIWWGFEVQVVFPLAEKLWGGHVHPDHHLVREAGLLYGRLQQVQSWRGVSARGMDTVR